MKRSFLTAALLAVLTLFSVLTMPAVADCIDDTTSPDPIDIGSVSDINDLSASFCVNGVVVNPTTMQSLDVVGYRAYGCSNNGCKKKIEYPAQYIMCSFKSNSSLISLPGVGISGLKPGTNYNMAIVAYDSCGNETDITEDFSFKTTGGINLAPSIPDTLMIDSQNENSLSISWNNSTNPEQHAILHKLRYKERFSSKWREVKNIQKQSYVLNDLLSGTEYEVQIQAINQEENKSGWSQSVHGITLGMKSSFRCIAATIENHLNNGKAYRLNKKYYAVGSNDYLGRTSYYNISLKETAAGYYDVINGC